MMRAVSIILLNLQHKTQYDVIGGHSSRCFQKLNSDRFRAYFINNRSQLYRWMLLLAFAFTAVIMPAGVTPSAAKGFLIDSVRRHHRTWLLMAGYSDFRASPGGSRGIFCAPSGAWSLLKKTRCTEMLILSKKKEVLMAAFLYPR